MAKRLRTNESIAWKHCSRVNDEQASCKLCGEILWCKGGSTSTLIKHLQKRHPIQPEVLTSRTSNACTSSSSVSSAATNSTGKITGFFNRAIPPMNRDREEQFKQKVVDMIIQDLRPLSIATSKGFRSLMDFMQPSCPVLGYKSVISRVEKRFVAQRKSLRTVLNAVGKDMKLCLTTDGWSSNQNESFNAVTCHFVDQQWKLQTYLLSLCHLEERHTAEHLQLAMESVLDDWNIDYVFACVSDNAANVASAMHNCRRILHDLKCFGHTSQLAVNKALTAEGTVTESVNAIRKVARFFRKSGPAWNKLKESQSREIKRRKKENGKLPREQQDPAVKRLKPLRPIMDCETRWNSKLYMCERMLSLRTHVTIVSQDQTLRKEMKKNKLPSDTQWALVENVVGILRPFVNEINTWSGEKYATLSSIYPTIFGLLDLIKVPQCEEIEVGESEANENAMGGDNLIEDAPTNDVEVDEDDDVIRPTSHFKQLLADEVRKRFLSGNYPANITSVAAMLDPRFKTLPFLSDIDRESVKAYAKKLFESLHSNEAGSTVGSTPATMSRPNASPTPTTTISSRAGASSMGSGTHSAQLPASSQLPATANARCDLISRIYKPQSATQTTNVIACNLLNSGEEFAEELSKYMKQDVAGLCENPLEWWLKNGFRFPLVSRLAAQVLSIPATSCASERVFSAAGNVITKKRAQLSSAHAEMLVFLYENGNFGDVASGEDKEEAGGDGGDSTDEEEVNDDDEGDHDSDDESAASASVC